MVFNGADDMGEMSASVKDDGNVQHRVIDLIGLIIARVERRKAY